MTDFTPCACLGPINGEPHCPCAMKQLRLPRLPEPHREDLRAALVKVFQHSTEVAETILRNRP